MPMLRISGLTLITALMVLTGFAQNKKEANALFQSGNYEDALEAYKTLLEEEPENLEFNYRAGICYLNTNIDRSMAVPLLEKIISGEQCPPDAMYLLGRAYHYTYEFDKAMGAFNTFRDKKEGTEDNIKDAEIQIEYCQNGKELIKFPIDVTFENLGSDVNSAFADYFPFVPVDESFIAFNSKRDDGSLQNSDGSYTSNIYFSPVKEGNFGKANKAISHPDKNEEIVGLSSGGDLALLYFDNENDFGDIHLAGITDGRFDKPVKLDRSINSKATEIAASITTEGNAIYFASDRSGGYGGVDLYVSRKLPNGKWGPAENLGPNINTVRDEDFPNISPDGKTIYFSSKGHSSMGGYDIFKATWDPEKSKFSGVYNIGFPINTPEDNMNFCVSKTGRYGYIAALRHGGRGNLDIYRVTFNHVEPRYTVISGFLKSARSGKPIDEPVLTVSDPETGKEYGTYLPNPRNLRYVIILPPGKFHLTVRAPGFEAYTETLELFDKSSYKKILEKDIVLK